MHALRTLLNIRYLPLLFAAAPQSYAVYLWLWASSDRSTAAFCFAVIGALGYEAIYVGAIAWTEEANIGRGAFLTATVALIFSVAVAIYVHRAQGWAALLHAGFPIVAYCYTLHMHLSVALRQQAGHGVQALDELRQQLATHERDAAHWRAVAAHWEQQAEQRRAELTQQEPPTAHPDDLDLVALAKALRTPHAEARSWRELEQLLRRPQSTIRSWLAKTNGHMEVVS